MELYDVELQVKQRSDIISHNQESTNMVLVAMDLQAGEI
jgi:hypothetical protein